MKSLYFAMRYSLIMLSFDIEMQYDVLTTSLRNPHVDKFTLKAHF